MGFSNFQSSAPQSETISPAIPEEGTIEEALEILDDSNWTNVEQFLRPWGEREVTLVHLAAYRGKIDVLNRAVALGALRSTSTFHLYDLDGFGRSAFHHAADQGHINVIEWLMDQPAAHEGPSERTSSTEDQASPSAFGSNTAPHQDVETKPQETTLLVEQSEDDELRKRSPISFDIPDTDGWTPLHAAVYGGHLDCVRFLIKKGLCLANATKTGVTVMKAIFEEVPHPTAFLKDILDKQVSLADDSDHKVKLDFTILAAPANCARVQEVESTSIANLVVVSALHNAVRNEEDQDILKHPLVTTFIHQKFPLTTPFHLFILFCDLCNAMLLYEYYAWTKTRIAEDLPTSFALRVTGITLNAVAILMTILDIVGNCRDKVVRIFFSTSYLYTVLIIPRFIIPIYTLVVIEMCSTDSGLNCSLTKDNAIMITLYWVYILTTFTLLPCVGLYVFMFMTVLMNVVKVLGISSVLIIGFSLTFRILFFNVDQFSTPWKDLGKTLVMMTDEYDYNYDYDYDYNDTFSSTNKIDDLFPSTNKTDDLFSSINKIDDLFPSTNKTDDLFPSTSKTDVAPSVETEAVLFSIFLKVVGIVLMNLIIGLAVNDTKRLLEKSRTAWLPQLILLRFQWLGLYYLMSRVLTRFQNCEQTEELTRTVLLDLKSTSWIPWLRLPKQVKNGLLELALKNSSNRGEKSQADLLRDDMRESLTALGTLLIAEIRSTRQPSLRGVVVEQQLQNLAASFRDDIQESVTDLQNITLTGIRSLHSSLQEVVVEQQLQHCQLQQFIQNRMTES